MTAGNQPSSSGGAQAIVDRLRAGSKINSGNARPSRIAMKEAADLIEGTFSGAQAAPEPPSNAYASELTADCTKLLPGGTLDDSAYSQIEDALDAIEAPMIDENGRYLTLVERIKALPSCSVPSTTCAGAVTKHSGTFLGYRDERGNEMHCAHAFCPHQAKCHKGCTSPVAISSTQEKSP